MSTAPSTQLGPGGIAARLAWTGYLGLQRLQQPRFPFRSMEAIRKVQERRIRAAVDHAYRHVPHYRETIDRLGLSPEELRTAADLGRLPMIDRRQLQRDPLQFVSRAQPLDRYMKLQTGGSSGAPITVYRDVPTIGGVGYDERHRAVERHFMARRRPPRVLRIVSPISPGQVVRESVSRRILLPGRLRREVFELSLMTPPTEALEAINELRPDVLMSYGSYLEALFGHLQRSGARFHRPDAVVYHSDALSEPARRLIADDLGIEILSYYSSVEAPAISFECEQHRGLHLNFDLHPVRIVDEEGHEVADGESGEVVVSNLISRGTMLFNYRQGDVAAKLPDPCPCGRTLPLLSFLEGRVGDWVATRDGQRLHPQGIRTLFTEEREVWGYQVNQRALSHFALTLVVAPESDRAQLEARLAASFAERLGPETTIETTYVESLPRTARGKIRTVIALPQERVEVEAR